MEDHFPVSLLGQKFPVSLGRFNDQLCRLLLTVPGKGYRSLYKTAFFVIFCFIVIFVEKETSLSSRIYMETHLYRVFLDTLQFLCHRNNGPCFYQHRKRRQSPVHIHHSSAPVSHAGKYIIPGSFRKPGFYLSYIQTADLRGCNRSAQKLAAEEILVWHFISFPGFRIIIVHRKHQRQIFLISPVVHGVKIRHQPVSQPEEVFHHICDVLPVSPGLLCVKLAVAGVETHHRRKYSKLKPASCHLIILDPHHMTADIMAPHAVSDIRGSRCEIRLESQRGPGHDSISRKSHRITVASRSCVSGKGHWPFSVPSAVQVMIVVQHPEGIQSFYLAESSGLPVQPPEIDSLLFHRMENMLKACFQEFWICRIKVYRLFLLPIDSHFFCHCPVLFLMGPDTVCRMDIQSHPLIPVMKPLKKLLRIRKQVPVPGIAGPAASVLGINVYQVPVHIDNSHRKRNLLLFKSVHQFFVGFFCIFIISAPPVS